MAVKLNKSGESHLRSLIEAGSYNADAAWDFAASDENALLGDKGDDWTRYASVHLGEDDGATADTKAQWKYPAAKTDGASEKVYRSGLIAAKQRAAQQGETDIENAASSLIDLIDEKEGKDKESPAEDKNEGAEARTMLPAGKVRRTDLPHVMGRIFDAPLLIDSGKLDIILSALGPRLNLFVDPPRMISAKVDGGAATDLDEVVPTGPLVLSGDAEDGGDDDCYAVTQDGIALIEVDGTLVYKSSWLAALSGMQSYSSISSAVAKAVADPAVKGILLMVGSNGGEAAGCFDCSDAIYAARASKPVYGVATDSAYSGGYALLSAAEKIFVSRTGGVGSIGVAIAHVDQSAQDKMEGVKYTYIYSGARKIDGNPHLALSPEARATMQAEADRLRGVFAASVAKYRGMSVEAVLETQAAHYFAENAVSAKLADQIGSPDDAYAALVADIAAKASAPVALPQTVRVETGAEAPKLETTAPVAEAAKPTTAEIFNLDDVRKKAGAETRAEITEIIELCKIAGLPELSSGFIRDGVGIALVREKLQMRRAETSNARNVSGHIAADAGENRTQQVQAGWESAVRKACGGKLKGE